MPKDLSKVPIIEAAMQDVRKQESEAMSALSKVRGALRSLELELVEAKHGVRVGSIVESDKGKVYKITVIKGSGFSSPWIEGTPRNKDGSWSKAVQNVYGKWTLIEA